MTIEDKAKITRNINQINKWLILLLIGIRYTVTVTHYDCDLFVIGAGSGGVRAARLAAENGLKTIIAEHSSLGGTCVNRGCVPKKLMVYAAEYGEKQDHMLDFGWHLNEKGTFDWPLLKNNKDAFIAKLNKIYDGLLHRAGVQIIPAKATVTGAQQVQADGKLYRSRHILLATGSYPRRADIVGADLTITSDEMFHLPSWPQSILIVGGGYIALEFAGICHRLGVRTTLIHRHDQLLRGFDRELTGFLMEDMHRQGMDMCLGNTIKRVEQAEKGLRATLDDNTVLTADQIMYAIGRVPASTGLGLEEAGVQLGSRGEVIVDDNFCSNVPSISAIGDLIGRVALTPVAIAEATAFVRTLRGGDGRMDYANIPSAVFSNPPLASVGLTEEEARDQYQRIHVQRSRFTPLHHSLTKETAQKVFIKVISREDDQRVLGMHMGGPDSAEIIQALAIAMQAGLSTKTLSDTIALHPTMAEEFVSL